MVTGPGLLPRVTSAATVPSFSVRAGVGVTMAAPSGLTVKVTCTPGMPVPVLSATFRTNGVAKLAPTVRILAVAAYDAHGDGFHCLRRQQPHTVIEGVRDVHVACRIHRDTKRV